MENIKKRPGDICRGTFYFQRLFNPRHPLIRIIRDTL